MAAVELLDNNFSPFCSANDFPYWLTTSKWITEEKIKAASMAWLEAADACLILPSYLSSMGSLAEMARANELGIPMFYNMESLKKWREEQ